MSRTQKNKATSFHLGQLKAKLGTSVLIAILTFVLSSNQANKDSEIKTRVIDTYEQRRWRRWLVYLEQDIDDGISN
jgi:hypothetical protein